MIYNETPKKNKTIFSKTRFLLDFSRIKTIHLTNKFLFYYFFKMSEEIKTQNEQKNTVATVGMWFSII